MTVMELMHVRRVGGTDRGSGQVAVVFAHTVDGRRWPQIEGQVQPVLLGTVRPGPKRVAVFLGSMTGIPSSGFHVP